MVTTPVHKISKKIQLYKENYFSIFCIILGLVPEAQAGKKKNDLPYFGHMNTMEF